MRIDGLHDARERARANSVRKITTSNPPASECCGQKPALPCWTPSGISRIDGATIGFAAVAGNQLRHFRAARLSSVSTRRPAKPFSEFSVSMFTIYAASGGFRFHRVGQVFLPVRV